MTAGCTAYMNGDSLEAAIEACENNGGLHKIVATAGIMHFECENGLKKYNVQDGT